MTTTLPMLETHPRPYTVDRAQLAATIDAVADCAEACTACADACLGEDMVADLTRCIRIDLDCADICAATARVLSRHTGYDAVLARNVVETCVVACRSCGDECARHASLHEHCRICAAACRTCEAACRDLLTIMR